MADNSSKQENYINLRKEGNYIFVVYLVKIKSSNYKISCNAFFCFKLGLVTIALSFTTSVITVL